MPSATTVRDEGQQLLHELRQIRDDLSDYAEQHPLSVDVRWAQGQMERATEIAIRAGIKLGSEFSASTFLGYVIAEYAAIIRIDTNAKARHFYG